jgi:NAD-dependent DNA ligase
MENVKALLRRAALAYYNGKPFMSDEEFDRLAELHNFEEIGTTDNRFSHIFRLYSLQKVFDNELDAKNPFQTYKKPVIVSPKLDGAAVALTYVQGNLHRVLTRGDGKRGLDVTHLVKYLVPNRISLETLPLMQITGEIVAPKTIKNSRNYAAGALNLKDPAEFQTRELGFIGYSVEPNIADTFSESMHILKNSMGFSTVLDADWNEYPQDGLVFRVDSNKDYFNFGYTAHHPKGAYALKKRQKGKVTTLVDVLWNVGKSGVVAPVAILKPVEIDDAMISRATLHNMAYIEALNLKIGCKVEVIRSGEIIPRIVRRVD